MGAEEQDEPARAAQLGGLGERGLGPGGLDDDVVLTARDDGGAQALARGPLMRMPCRERRLGTEPDRAGDRDQPDRPAPDDGDPRSGADVCDPQPVDRHGHGLDQARLAHLESGRERHDGRGGDDHGVREPPVSADAERAGRAAATAMRGARRGTGRSRRTGGSGRSPPSSRPRADPRTRGRG